MGAVLWKRHAINDMAQIARRIALDSPIVANQFIRQLQAKTENLATYPQPGRLGRKYGTRELIAHRHFVVIYRERAGNVEILRVKHTAQQWP